MEYFFYCKNANYKPGYGVGNGILLFSKPKSMESLWSSNYDSFRKVLVLLDS